MKFFGDKNRGRTGAALTGAAFAGASAAGVSTGPVSWRSRIAVGGLALTYGLVLGLSVLTVLPGEAHALRVTMKRIVFEGPKRADVITLINNTNEEAAYRLGWRRMRMTTDDGLEVLEEGDPGADLNPADDMVIYSPRRVVLPPGGSQQVRLLLRRPRDLADGEYRSHFWVEPEAAAVKFDLTDEERNTDKPMVKIKMLTGLTLPVIVRAGNLTATAGIVDPAVSRSAQGLDVRFGITREGNRSLYGDLDFSCDGTLVHQVRGIAVYPEIARRNVRYVISNPPASCGTMTVTFKAPEDDALFRGAVMAEASFAVP